MKRILFILSLLFLAGCINYEETLTLKSDGSGEMLMHYSISEQLSSMMALGGGQQEEGKNEMPFKFKENEIRAGLQAEGVQVKKIEMKAEGGQQHVYVTVDFKKVTDLNNTTTFKEMPFVWEEEEKAIVYSHTLKNKNPQGQQDDGSQAGGQMGDQMAKAMLGNAAFSFKVKLPDKALPAPNTNGTILEDGKTVTWTFPLAEMGSGDKLMTAKFKKGGLPLGLIGLAAGAFLISIIAAVVVILFARKG